MKPRKRPPSLSPSHSGEESGGPASKAESRSSLSVDGRSSLSPPPDTRGSSASSLESLGFFGAGQQNVALHPHPERSTVNLDIAIFDVDGTLTKMSGDDLSGSPFFQPFKSACDMAELTEEAQAALTETLVEQLEALSKSDPHSDAYQFYQKIIITNDAKDVYQQVVDAGQDLVLISRSYDAFIKARLRHAGLPEQGSGNNIIKIMDKSQIEERDNSKEEVAQEAIQEIVTLRLREPTFTGKQVRVRVSAFDDVDFEVSAMHKGVVQALEHMHQNGNNVLLSPHDKNGSIVTAQKAPPGGLTASQLAPFLPKPPTMGAAPR